jgi:hypothetical protein
MAPSKYHNRLYQVCRACAVALPLERAVPADARPLPEGDVWLSAQGEPFVVGAPAKCPSCGEAWRGFTADSGAEARRYAALRALERAGQIRGLAVHPRYVVLGAFRDRYGRSHRAIEYEGDFAYEEEGVAVVEDVKGYVTGEFRLKRIMFLRHCRQYELRVIRAEDVA